MAFTYNPADQLFGGEDEDKPFGGSGGGGMGGPGIPESGPVNEVVGGVQNIYDTARGKKKIDWGSPGGTEYINNRGIAGGGMNPDQQAVSDHLGTAPEWGGGEYGWDIGSYDFDPENDWYDPTKLGDEGYELNELQAMNFDPYRRNALQDVSATSASGLASAEGGLARTGGVSAADRMALASQFNRDKISGRSGALGKYDEFEAKNIYDVENANVGIQNKATTWNAEQQTEKDRSSAEQVLSARDKTTDAENLYNQQDSNRRYKEDMDKYNADLERWYLEGQFIAGGARKPEPPSPPENIGEDDEGPGEDAVAGSVDTPLSRSADRVRGQRMPGF